MSDDVIERVQAVDPCPDGSLGWSDSDEGRSALAAVLSGVSAAWPKTRRSWPTLAVAAAVTVLAVVGTLIAVGDRETGQRVDTGADPTGTSPAGAVERDPGPLADIDGQPYLLIGMGDRVLFWGPDGSAEIFDPAAGTWTAAAAAPKPAPAGGHAIWTGSTLIHWGDKDSEGAEYDPRSDAWRTIASAPITRQTPAAVGWDGEEVLIWGPASDAAPGESSGAAYDPATDTWRLLGSSSPGDVQGRLEASGPDDLLAWVSEPSIAGTDFRTPVLASYSRSRDSWRQLTQAPSIVKPANGLLLTGVFDGLVIAVPSVPDLETGERRAAEWRSDGGWKTFGLPASSNSGRCRTAVVSLAESPAIVQCENVTWRRSDGSWVPAPEAPGGSVLPLEHDGFVLVDDESRRVWWYR